MADLGQVRMIAMGLPQSEERESRGRVQWRVGERLFVWERPLRAKEVLELGAGAPDGAILGARVEHEGAKRALITDDPDVYFTTSHFDGHASILVRLDAIDLPRLEELIVEAWLVRAPKRLAEQFAIERFGDPGRS
jgi:hypothetical protein